MSLRPTAVDDEGGDVGGCEGVRVGSGEGEECEEIW